MRLVPILSIALGTAVAMPAAASACDYTLELHPPQLVTEDGYFEDVPANRLFVLPASRELLEIWDDWGEGDPPELVVDEALEALFEAGKEDNVSDVDYEVVHRLVDPEAFIGRQALISGCTTAEGDPCGFTLGSLDLTPPSRPEVSGLQVFLHATHGGGPIDCPNIESMIFEVEATDDRAAPEYLRLAAYIAADEAALAEVTEPSVVWQPWGGFEPLPPEVSIPLGEGGEHFRDGHHFRREGRYCFSIAAIDMAGNVSERSAPECIDTTDIGDPRVELERSGCECSTGRASWAGAPWMLMALLVGWRRRRLLERRP